MKNIKYLTLAFVMIACTNEDQNITAIPTELNIGDLLSQVTTDYSQLNYITISASNVYGVTAQVDIHKQFLPSKNIDNLRKESSKLLIDNKLIDPQMDRMVYSMYDENDNLENFIPKFGQKIIVTIEEINANGKTFSEHEVYNPALIKIINATELKTISRNNDITIKWEPDPANDKPITIQLIGRQFNENNEPLDNIDLLKAVNDVGIFTIDSNDLSIFPTNTRIDIVIARGNQEVIDENAITLYNSDLIEATIL